MSGCRGTPLRSEGGERHSVEQTIYEFWVELRLGQTQFCVYINYADLEIFERGGRGQFDQPLITTFVHHSVRKGRGFQP